MLLEWESELATPAGIASTRKNASLVCPTYRNGLIEGVSEYSRLSNPKRADAAFVTATAGITLHAALIGSDIAELDIENIRVRSATPVLGPCRRLVAKVFPVDTKLDVYRGGALALRVRSIVEAACLRIGSHGVGEGRPRHNHCD